MKIANIPWIAGIRKLPPNLLVIAPGISAVCEEFFFRGIILLLLLNRLHVRPWVAVAMVTVLFTFGQLLQVRIVPQKVVIGCGCLAISLVGGGLVVQTGSLSPLPKHRVRLQHRFPCLGSVFYIAHIAACLPAFAVRIRTRD